MKRLLLICFLASLALVAAAATHVLVLLPGDTGIIQCPGGVLTLLESGPNQVSAICGDAPTPTATDTPTATSTATPTPTATDTQPPTETHTATPSATASNTPTQTSTRTVPNTRIPTASRTATRTPTATATPTPTSTIYLPLIAHFAVICDSMCDEYQSNDHRGGTHYPTTFNWIELLVDLRGFDFGQWGTWGEPRRSGYEYMWGRSGDTSLDGRQNQLPGVLAQLSNDPALYVLVQIGLNDFNQGDQLGYRIYSGSISGQALTNTLNVIADNISYIGRQANLVAPGRVLIGSLQDYVDPLIYPEVAIYYPNPVGRARSKAATAYINTRVQAQAAVDGVRYWDYNAAFAAELGPRTSGGSFVVGGQNVVWLTRGNEYHYAWLNESPYAHAGTVLSGLISNLYVRAINENFGMTFVPLSDAEILAAAGG